MFHASLVPPHLWRTVQAYGVPVKDDYSFSVPHLIARLQGCRYHNQPGLLCCFLPKRVNDNLATGDVASWEIPQPPRVTRSRIETLDAEAWLCYTLTVRLGRSLSSGLRPIVCNMPDTAYLRACSPFSHAQEAGQLTSTLGLSLS